MSWLTRLFRSQPSGPEGGPQAAERCLTAAGWSSGRATDLTAVEQALAASGLKLHDAARRFLTEYQGLAIDVPIDGAPGLLGFVEFVPERVLRFLGPDDAAFAQNLLTRDICPVGTTSGHTVFIFLDAEERSYLIDMEWQLLAPLATTIGDMVQILCDGRNGRVDAQILDEQGAPSGAVIRGDNERQHWNLSEFPHTSKFLPPVSLSPARRPPTWRPMVRAAEQNLAKGTRPEKLLITCGGLTSTPAGQYYFVAHCENSRYVRAQGRFQVSKPPPGIATEPRVGEILPVNPPGK